MVQNKESKRSECRSSRFFVTETPPARVSINSSTSSKYFVDSPSSAIGSFRSMPNFLRTLIPPDVEQSILVAAQNEQKSCSCTHLFKAARKQFVHCPIFEQTLRSLKSCEVTSDNDLICCDKEILLLIQSVLHICSHACYLRAFAPLRDWHSLRTSISELSGRSPGKNGLFNSPFPIQIVE